MGLWLFRSLRSNRRAQRPPPTNSPKPQAPLRPPISQEPRNEQTKCSLFSPNFPAELRISIYEAVLGDRHRFMHVIPFDDQSNRVGRRRCEDTACEGPTWQHKCFGTWLERQGSSRKRNFTFHSSDQMLALLLSCHRMCVCFNESSQLCLQLTQLLGSNPYPVHSQHIQLEGGPGYISLQFCHATTPVAPNSLLECLDNIFDTTEILARARNVPSG